MLENLYQRIDDEEGRIIFSPVVCTPAPEPEPEPEFLTAPPVPEVTALVPSFAEDGISRPVFSNPLPNRGICFRPDASEMTSPELLLKASAFIWSSSDDAPSTIQTNEINPNILQPRYFNQFTVLTQPQFDAWEAHALDNGHNVNDGIIGPVTKPGGSEKYWSNPFNPAYRDWVYNEAVKLANRCEALLHDVAYADIPPKPMPPGYADKVEWRNHWQHAVGSLVRGVIKETGKPGIVNVSRYRWDRCWIVSQYAGGLYLDRYAMPDAASDNRYQMERVLMQNPFQRSARRPDDIYTFQDSLGGDKYAVTETPEYENYCYTVYLMRLASMGGFHGCHFYGLRNNADYRTVDGKRVSGRSELERHTHRLVWEIDPGQPVEATSRDGWLFSAVFENLRVWLWPRDMEDTITVTLPVGGIGVDSSGYPNVSQLYSAGDTHTFNPGDVLILVTN